MTCVRSVSEIMYESETWALNVDQSARLDRDEDGTIDVWYIFEDTVPS